MKTNRKLILIVAVMFVMVSSYSMQTVAAFDLDPGGGGDPQQVYASRTMDGAYRLSWRFHVATIFGIAIYKWTWMEIGLHEVTLDYNYGPDGYVVTGYDLEFEFSWDTTWLTGMKGDVLMDYGASYADRWGHSYELDVGELGNGEVETVSHDVNDVESSWSTKYFRAKLMANLGFMGLWYTMELGFKLNSPTVQWNFYFEDIDSENWEYFLSAGLDLDSI